MKVTRLETFLTNAGLRNYLFEARDFLLLPILHYGKILFSQVSDVTARFVSNNYRH